MFKRMIVAVITFAALLCFGVSFRVEAAGHYGNGEGNWREQYKVEVPKISVTPVNPTPVNPMPVNPTQPNGDPFADIYNSNDTWLIQWYLCGSDLESKYGCATNDLQELLKVKLPANISVVIQTGGSKIWQNDTMSNTAIGRYLYDSNGLQLLETLPDASMGDVNTLTDFVRYGKEKFSADHRVFVFWDHGGGSVRGLCFDERTSKGLSVNDLTEAFGAVYNPSSENHPFEMIGFDTCLMATYDTINALDGFTKYVTASEESEPGIGWNYSGWLGALAQNPAMGGAKLGREICDSYISACKNYNVADSVTLSVVDMNKLPVIREAYENFGMEALVKAYKNPRKFFANFGQGADNAENYANDRKKGRYSHMVDIADLARCNKNLLNETADNLIGIVNDAVVYKVCGQYRNRGGGLSSFYPYVNDENFLNGFINLKSAPVPQKFLYYYRIYGDLPDEVKPMLEQLANNVTDIEETVPEKPAPETHSSGRQDIFGKGDLLNTPPAERKNLFDISSLDEFPVQIDNDGNAFVELTAEQVNLLSSVHCQLIYMGLENDVLLYLGSDTDIKADWSKGRFTDNFRNVWPMIDGHPVYVEIVGENDDYNLYSIPIKLNGVEHKLQVAYVYADKEYRILGASRGLDDNGMSYRDLIQLKAGDEITTIHYAMTISGDDQEFQSVEGETFTVNDNTTVTDSTLGDGNYAYCFEFISPDGNSTMSALVVFTVKDGKITTSVNNKS